MPISAHVACARVWRQLYVLCTSHALVQATVGAGTVIIVYIGVAYTGGGGLGNYLNHNFSTSYWFSWVESDLHSIDGIDVIVICMEVDYGKVV